MARLEPFMFSTRAVSTPVRSVRRIGLDGAKNPVPRRSVNDTRRRHPATQGAVWFFACLALVFGLAVQPAQAEKYAAIVVDAKTGKTLHSRHADARRYPASLTKVMTLYLMFEALKTGRVRMDTPMRVSRYAAARPPSKLGLRAGSKIRVKDAILALVTKSANDVATVVAEHLAGSERKFAQRMTAKARALGMKNTRFTNASGLPSKGQVTTARDMVLLGRAIQVRFPHYYRLFKTRSFRYGGRRYRNHNRLLGKVRGIDGIKTGYTRASGFNLISSAHYKKRHIIAVVLGGRTAKSRDNHMKTLIARYLPKASRGRYRNWMALKAQPAVKSALAHRMPLPNPRRVRARENGREKAIRAMITNSTSQPGKAQPQAASPDSRVVVTKPFVVPLPRPQTDEIASLAQATGMRGKVPLEESKVSSQALAYAGEESQGSTEQSILQGFGLDGEARQRPQGWAIQIGSLDSALNAAALLKQARRAVGRPLGDAEPYIEKWTVGERIFYRARFTGLTRRSARNACRNLKRKKFSCFEIAQ